MYFTVSFKIPVLTDFLLAYEEMDFIVTLPFIHRCQKSYMVILFVSAPIPPLCSLTPLLCSWPPSFCSHEEYSYILVHFSSLLLDFPILSYSLVCAHTCMYAWMHTIFQCTFAFQRKHKMFVSSLSQLSSH